MPYRSSPVGRSCAPIWDPTDQLLYLLLRRVARGAAFTAAIASSVSCLEEPLPPDTHGEPPFEPLLCVQHGALPLAGLALELDSLELGRAPYGNNRVATIAGTPCAGAERPEECSAKRATLIAQALESDVCNGDQWGNCFGRPYIITTTGDDVELAAVSGPELHAILGDIDTPAEAALVLGLHVPESGCDTTEKAPVYRLVRQGVEVRTLQSTGVCPTVTSSVVQLVARDGTLSEVSSEVVGIDPLFCFAEPGRRPAGLVASAHRPASTELGRFFQGAAALEAASVRAFEMIGRELHALGAPAALQRKAREAVDDEVDHSWRMARLAERFAATAYVPSVCDTPLRDRFALALDNAVEGCVRETFAALLATYQAAHALDAEVLQAFARISRDETRHASLAWQLQAWLEAELLPAQRERVHAAQRAAVQALRDELAKEADPELRRVAGLPDARTALLLHDGLRRALWEREPASA
jgi:hypothetical protein